MIKALCAFFILVGLALAVVGLVDGKNNESPWLLAYMAACAGNVLKEGAA